eukprot:GHVH01010030.1.p1 GENE.GHVH01010030.1~~GHVH01010030.1.p1  ORF type:complete len:221 (+),score=33.89 GHVH01010030.1:93-755(+)
MYSFVLALPGIIAANNSQSDDYQPASDKKEEAVFMDYPGFALGGKIHSVDVIDELPSGFLSSDNHSYGYGEVDYVDENGQVVEPPLDEDGNAIPPPPYAMDADGNPVDIDGMSADLNEDEIIAGQTWHKKYRRQAMPYYSSYRPQYHYGGGGMYPYGGGRNHMSSYGGNRTSSMGQYNQGNRYNNSSGWDRGYNNSSGGSYNNGQHAMNSGANYGTRMYH